MHFTLSFSFPLAIPTNMCYTFIDPNDHSKGRFCHEKNVGVSICDFAGAFFDFL